METAPSSPSLARREWWPLAIVLSFVFFIAFILFWVMVMTKNKSELISPDYYTRELTYQDQIDKTHRAVAMKRSALVQLDRKEGVLVITFPADSSGPQSISGTVDIMRPSASALDFRRMLDLPAGSRSVRILMQDAPSGLWTVMIDWKEGDHSFYQEESIYR